MIEKKLFFVKGKVLTRLSFILFYTAIIATIIYIPTWVGSLILFKKKEITVFSFSDIIPESLFRKFEKVSGIKVNNKYCDSDAEIWSQLYMGSGEGYDLITPTDYMVQTMKRDHLIKSFNFDSEISRESMSRIDPRFAPQKNQECFSVPFAWSVHGIGFRKKFFVRRGLFTPDSWSFIFERPDWIGHKKSLKKYGVCLSDDPLDIVFISNIYLTRDVVDFSKENIDRILNLLIAQKPLVKAYANSNVIYYLMHICPIAIAISGHMKIPLEEHGDTVGFSVPKEGGLMSVQHFAIPKHSKNPDLAIEFINFLLKEENGIEIFNKRGFFPVTNGALLEIQKSDLDIVKEVFVKKRPLKALNANLKLTDAYKILMGVKSI